MSQDYIDLERDARQFTSALETDFKRLPVPWLDPTFETRFILLKRKILEMCRAQVPDDCYPVQAFETIKNLEELFKRNGDRAKIEAQILSLQKALHMF